MFFAGSYPEFSVFVCCVCDVNVLYFYASLCGYDNGGDGWFVLYFFFFQFFEGEEGLPLRVDFNPFCLFFVLNDFLF